MADANPAYRTSTADALAIDQGLRTYMIGVYQYMMLGVAVTGAVAWLVSTQTAFVHAVWASQFLLFLLAFAPVPISLYLQVRIWHMNTSTAQALFWTYAALMGVWFGVILGKFTDASVARVFLITAASFGGLSLYGYTTPRSLSGMGSFLIMGMWGVFFMALASWLFPSPMFINVICVLGVLVFAGLTAHDTQQIKEMYLADDEDNVAQRKSILGATWLYISFVAIFQYLLSLIGDRE